MQNVYFGSESGYYDQTFIPAPPPPTYYYIPPPTLIMLPQLIFQPSPKNVNQEIIPTKDSAKEQEKWTLVDDTTLDKLALQADKVKQEKHEEEDGRPELINWKE